MLFYGVFSLWFSMFVVSMLLCFFHGFSTVLSTCLGFLRFCFSEGLLCLPYEKGVLEVIS